MGYDYWLIVFAFIAAAIPLIREGSTFYKNYKKAQTPATKKKYSYKIIFNVVIFFLAIGVAFISIKKQLHDDSINEADQNAHKKEVDSLNKQIFNLSSGIKNITGISSELKKTVNNFDSLYKKNAKAQDTINESILSLNNFPIIETSIYSNNDKDSILSVRLKNDGKTNIKLVHFDLNSTIDSISFSKDIPLIVRGSGPLVKNFKIPRNTPQISLDGHVWWDGVDFRAYTYWLEFKGTPNGLNNKPTQRFNYYGQNQAKAFNPKKVLAKYLKESKKRLNNK